jgi:hypothetical protein
MERDPGAALPAALAPAHAQIAFYYGTTNPQEEREAAAALSARADLLGPWDPLVTVARAAVASLTMQPGARNALIRVHSPWTPHSGRLGNCGVRSGRSRSGPSYHRLHAIPAAKWFQGQCAQ